MTPFAGGMISDEGVIPDPIAALPPVQSLAGWASMLQEGSETPVFDWITLIHGPINPTDGTNKAYVDASIAVGGPLPNPLVFPVSIEVTGSVTVDGQLILADGSSVPTAAPGTSSGQVASTAFVTSAIALAPYLPLAGGTLSGPAFLFAGSTVPTAPGTAHDTRIASTEFVTSAIAAAPFLPLLGGVMTGAVVLFAGSTAPTAAPGTSNLLIASTAFVAAAIAAGGTITGPIILPNLPLDNVGLAPGTLWNNSGVVSVA